MQVRFWGAAREVTGPGAAVAGRIGRIAKKEVSVSVVCPARGDQFGL